MQFARARRRLGGSRDDGAPTVKNENDSLRFRARAKSSRFAALEFLSTGSRPHPKHSPNNDTISPSTIFTSRSSTVVFHPRHRRGTYLYRSSTGRTVHSRHLHACRTRVTSSHRSWGSTRPRLPHAGGARASYRSRLHHYARTARTSGWVNNQGWGGRPARTSPGTSQTVLPYTHTVLSSSGSSGYSGYSNRNPSPVLLVYGKWFSSLFLVYDGLRFYNQTIIRTRYNC